MFIHMTDFCLHISSIKLLGRHCWIKTRIRKICGYVHVSSYNYLIERYHFVHLHLVHVQDCISVYCCYVLFNIMITEHKYLFVSVMPCAG